MQCVSANQILQSPKSTDAINCVNLAWSMESRVWDSIPNLGFTSKNDINKHVWYSIPSRVFNPKVSFASQVWYRGLVLAVISGFFFFYLKPGIQSQCWF